MSKKFIIVALLRALFTIGAIIAILFFLVSRVH
jgi:hypothetical protein